MTNAQTPEPLAGVAVIGMSGRFPGAKSVAAFWRNLREGVESISIFSDAQVLASGVAPNLLRNADYVKAGAVLEDPEWLDAAFFNLSPREAQIMDPQQRIFLECAWEALENAGYDSETYAGRIGVYAGASINTYVFNLYAQANRAETVDDFQAFIANDKDFLATRVSYKLGLKGPSIGIQTACSTSLVAIHLACQSLLYGECDIALAGGVSIKFPQQAGYLYQEGGILSPDGRCRAFDAEAQGTVGGSGAGVVVLKRLADAFADGDTIHAVIRSSAVNNDGAVKVGFTAPSVAGQAEVIAEAQAMAGVKPESITYIEAHGTGTPLGDPIELAALTQVFRSATQRAGFCAIGSVKTNIGHLDAAAGVAGLIKTVLALEHKAIPPSLHFKKPNPQIDFARSPFYVNATLADWNVQALPRRAGVSSFGIGGTNAHVVLEEAPPAPPAGESRHAHLLVLSARSNSALEDATRNLSAHFKRHPQLNLADAAYTLQVGRRAFSHRRFLVCHELHDAARSLAAGDPKRVITGVQDPVEPSVVFMFPGQGAQYVQMAAELYRGESSFRKDVDGCAEILLPHLGLDLRSVLYPDPERSQEATGRLDRTDSTQPALFVIEYALAKLWMQWGVHPQAMIGHSVGEFVAACLAGVFSLRDALELVAARGRLMSQLPAGAMLAVPLAESEVQNHLGEGLSLAALNGPSACVVSGPPKAVEALERKLARRGVLCRRLHTSHAFHSPMMEPILEPFTERFKAIALQSPTLPFVSNVSGTWITEAQAVDPHYWASHMRQTVRFSDGVQRLLKGSRRLLLEVGPGQTLSALAKQHPDKSPEHVVLSSMAHPRGAQPDVDFLLNTLGRLWLAGVRVDWKRFYANERRQRIPLPTYPFERQRYWLAPEKKPADAKSRQLSLLKQSDISDWFYVPSWKRSPELSMQECPSADKCRWLVFSDHWGLGSSLAMRLADTGHDVVTVTAAAGFARLFRDAYTIDPRNREDYIALFRDLLESGKSPNAILHLWSITPDDDAQSGITFAERHQDLGFYSLLFLAQALGHQSMWDPLQLVVVSSNLHDVTGSERLCPEKATVLGPCKVIPQEYSNINCRYIDVEVPPRAGSEQQVLVEQLATELTARAGEAVVAFRGKHRWVQTFEAVRLAENPNARARLRESGVYLITGGLGSLGLAVAEFLARQVKAKLILTGRRPFPERAAWQEWLADAISEKSEKDERWAIQNKIRRLQALEQLGASIQVVSADVANPKEMEKTVAATYERFGALHGVIHTAGILSDGIIQLKEPDVAASVLSPKVQGTLVLEAVLADTKLDFLVLFSSMRSILGGTGIVDYCAANAFLDAYAHYRGAKNGTFTVSVDWGVWREDGMSARGVARQPIQRDFAEGEPLALEEGMSSAEGVAALRRILNTSLPQVIVSTQDFHAVLRHYDSLASSDPRTFSQVSSQPQQAHPRPETASLYVAPRNPLERMIAAIWQELLGIERVSVHDNFFELGGDSVIGLRFISRAHEAGMRLTNRQIFEHQTIAELAAVADMAPVGRAFEQGVTTGAVPLTPIQHWFFEQRLADPHHWNMAIMVEAQTSLNLPLLERAVQQLIAHHDALRLSFVQDEYGWRQSYVTNNDATVVRVDLSTLAAAERAAAQEQAAAQLQTSLKLSDGALFKVLVFDFGPETPSRLLLVCHHLVVDIGSWRILLEDLGAIYQQLNRGEAIRLPAQSDSFGHWAQTMARHAQSMAVQEELEFWLAAQRAQVTRLPVDFAGGDNTVASVRHLAMSLDAKETRELLECSQAHHAQIGDVLLTALTMAFKSWTAAQTFLVDLEEDGREVFFDGVDVSRTVGWFTTVYPALLSLEGISSDEQAFWAVRDQLRSIAKHGIGYGLLRFMLGNKTIEDQLHSLPQPEVMFLHLGQFDQALGASSGFRPVEEMTGPARSPRGKRRHILEVITGVSTNGALQFQWLFSEHLHRRSTVEYLAQTVLDTLRLLVNRLRLAEVKGYRAADFPGARLDQKELEQFIASITKVASGD
jgi:non-ribosomal peptide synthase protein (TIGR01720 family)